MNAGTALSLLCRGVLALVLLALAALAPGCAPVARETAALGALDAPCAVPQGERLPARIACLDPAAAQLLCDWGNAGRLVGTVYSGAHTPTLPPTLPPALPLLGYAAHGPALALDTAAILKLQPDALIADVRQQAALAPLLAPAVNTRLPLVWLQTRDFTDAAANIRCLGALTGQEARARAHVTAQEEQLALLRRKLRALPARAALRVLPVLGVEGTGLRCAAPGSFHTALLRAAGADIPSLPNAAAQTPAQPGICPDKSLLLDAAGITAANIDIFCTDTATAGPLRALLHTQVGANAARVVSLPAHVWHHGWARYGTLAQDLAAALHDALPIALPDALCARTPLALPFGQVREACVGRERLCDVPGATLLLRLSPPQTVLSTQHGLRHGVRAVGNHSTPPAGWAVAHHLGMDALNARIARLYPGFPTPLLLHTGADVEHMVSVVLEEDDLRVGVMVTAGVCGNAQRAGEDAGEYVEPGTINIIALCNRRLSEAAMAQALMRITEAKSAALHELDIRSSYSGTPATGTGTDAVMLLGGEGNARTVSMAVGHTKLGELLARATRQAVREAITRHNGLTAQRPLAQRLAERGIDLAPPLPPEERESFGLHMLTALQQPEQGGLLRAALALADAAPAPPPDTAFARWCAHTARQARKAAGIADNAPLVDYYPAAPEPVRQALNAIAAGWRAPR